MQPGNDHVTEKRRKAVIYDLDGTVVDSTARIMKYLDLDAKARGDHEAYRKSHIGYASTTEGDVVIPSGVRLVQALIQAHNAVPIALTSRGNDGRGPTLRFLQQHMPWIVRDWFLYMRPERRDDPTDSLWRGTHAEVKAWALDSIEKEFEVIAVIDDNPHVCEMVQKRGLLAIQVYHPGINCLNPTGGVMP